ncbi:MAG TPA: hypothetical protein VE969_09515 [Pyrinomonadaceae bacterium]|nr:hypothetical protein [Pyrinomonadaceae bacterium]
MRTHRWKLLVVSALLLGVALGCNFSATTANISSVKLGKDKSVSSETSTFAPGDTIYAVGTVSNSPGKVKVKGVVAFDDVSGQTAGPVPGAEATVDLPGSGTATFTFTPPSVGWPAGKYKLEITMTDDNGKQVDHKTTAFTVS